MECACIGCFSCFSPLCFGRTLQIPHPEYLGVSQRLPWSGTQLGLVPGWQCHVMSVMVPGGDGAPGGPSEKGMGCDSFCRGLEMGWCSRGGLQDTGMALGPTSCSLIPWHHTGTAAAFAEPPILDYLGYLQFWASP